MIHTLVYDTIPQYKSSTLLPYDFRIIHHSYFRIIHHSYFNMIHTSHFRTIYLSIISADCNGGHRACCRGLSAVPSNIRIPVKTSSTHCHGKYIMIFHACLCCV